MKEIYVFVTHLQGISWSRTQQAKAACDIWCPIRDQEHSACLSQKLLKMPKNAKNGSQCNSPFFMSIVFSGGWKGPTRERSAAMWSGVFRGCPGDSKGQEAQNCIQPPRAQGEGLEPLLAAQETVSEAPEPKTCERVRKWHFPWIGKAHGFKEETQSELYFIILLNFNIFSQSTVKEVQPSCVSHIGFQF